MKKVISMVTAAVIAVGLGVVTPAVANIADTDSASNGVTQSVVLVDQAYAASKQLVFYYNGDSKVSKLEMSCKLSGDYVKVVSKPSWVHVMKYNSRKFNPVRVKVDGYKGSKRTGTLKIKVHGGKVDTIKIIEYGIKN